MSDDPVVPDHTLATLLDMYRERHAEVTRVIDTRSGEFDERLFAKRGEQIEYLFGCLDGLRMAINLLDPKMWAGARWRDFATWENSLKGAGSRG